MNKGRYSGKRISDIIQSEEGQKYVLSLHISHYGFELTGEVFISMGNIKNK